MLEMNNNNINFLIVIYYIHMIYIHLEVQIVHVTNLHYLKH